MRVIILLIAAGGTVAGGFLAAFAWAVRSGQFDDTVTPAVRMLLDDKNPAGSEVPEFRGSTADARRRSTSMEPRNPGTPEPHKS